MKVRMVIPTTTRRVETRIILAGGNSAGRRVAMIGSISDPVPTKRPIEPAPIMRKAKIGMAVMANATTMNNPAIDHRTSEERQSMSGRLIRRRGTRTFLDLGVREGLASRTAFAGLLARDFAVLAGLDFAGLVLAGLDLAGAETRWLPFTGRSRTPTARANSSA